MEVFIGTIVLVGFNFAPRGWALCAGQLLPIAQYQSLFALLGTQYGGNGQTNFALPDLRGRVAIGMGEGPGMPLYSLGQNGGLESVTLGIANMPAHNHTLNGHHRAGDSGVLGSGEVMAQGGADVAISPAGAPNVHMNDGTIGMTGGNRPVPVRNPFLTLNYIIATEGIFPAHA